MIIYMLSHTLIWSDLRRKPTANFASFTSISQENVQINNNDNEENSRESRNKGRPGTIHDVYTQTRRNANKNTINTSSHAFNLSIIGDIHQWSYVLTHTDLIRPQKKTYNIFFLQVLLQFHRKTYRLTTMINSMPAPILLSSFIACICWREIDHAMKKTWK